MSATRPDSRRIVELDGLRGVAVLLVLLAHYFGEVPSGWSFLALGWLGVDVFFVLSGFLIAGILLDHRGAANYFSTFYIRRSCRIFPIYFVFIPILVLFLSSLWARGHAWMEEPLPFAAYLSYTQNFAIAWLNRTGGLALLPTWTLAIEEQFYMLLPLMVYFVPRKRLLPICLGLIAVSPILRSMILYQYGSHLSVHVLLPCRWDSLFLGVTAAIVLRDSKLKKRALEGGGRCLKSIWVAGYAFLPLVILVEQSSEIPLRMSIAITLMAMGTAAYILLVVTQMTSVRWLRSSTLRFFGSISYGLYLVHQPVLVLMHGFLLGTSPDIATVPQLGVTILAMLASVGIAWASWTYFESRFVRYGRSWNYESQTEMRANPAGNVAV